jgi:hypothetical protein
MKLFPKCAKIKLHLLLHLPDQLRKFLANLSCFAAERKHKASKQICVFAFNHWCHTMLHRCVRNWLAKLAEPGQCEPFCMLQAKPVDWGPILATHNTGLALSHLPLQAESSDLQSPKGKMSTGDLVAFSLTGGLRVGFVKLFFQMSDGTMFAWILELAPRSAAVFSRDINEAKECLVRVQDLGGAFPYLPEGDVLLVVASGDTVG